jgi:hypothetical protein
MTLLEEFRKRLALRGALVGMHTAMLELREAVEDALTALGGMEPRSRREDMIYDEGMQEGEELAKATYLDENKEIRRSLTSNFADWGVPNYPPPNDP